LKGEANASILAPNQWEQNWKRAGGWLACRRPPSGWNTELYLQQQGFMTVLVSQGVYGCKVRGGLHLHTQAKACSIKRQSTGWRSRAAG